MNYNTVYVGMDVHKESFSLCLECKTKFHIHTEFSLTLFFHILYYFSTFYPQ